MTTTQGCINKRFEELCEAARNLGMSERDARFYAKQALQTEIANGDWVAVTQTPVMDLY